MRFKANLISDPVNFFLYLFVFIIPYLGGCTDDVIKPGDTGNQVNANGLVLMKLPGYLGLNLSTELNVETRAEEFAAGNPFMDGDAAEYALCSPDETNNEYYNYLLLFKSNVNDGHPIIFPIDETWTLFPDEMPTNNLTLTISKVFVNQMNGDVSGSSVKFPDSNSSLSEWQSFLSGMTAYAVLNFKLTDSGYGIDGSQANYVVPGVTTMPGTNTVEKLAGLTESQFKELSMRDFKVRGAGKVTAGEVGSSPTQRDYFIMSNSVYATSSSKVVGVTIDSSRIFTNQADAIAKPCLEVYVDRLAAKLSVQFDLGKLNAAQFDPYGQQQRILGVYFDENNKGLPVFLMEVEQVDMSQNNGITFDATNGYKINRKKVRATLRIMGFGLSNTEPDTYLFKDVNPSMSADFAGWAWNDPSNHRSYWARDPHYQISPPNGDTFYKNSKAKGYLHQFRLALDTDSVNSYHSGLMNGYSDYYDTPYEEYYVDNQPYKAYNNLGQIDVTKTVDKMGIDVSLRYKSYDDLLASFDDIQATKSEINGRYTYSPLYSLENTYYDPGTILGASTWVWPWNREPYATSTNLILLAEIEIEDNANGENPEESAAGEGPTLGFSTRDSESLNAGETRVLPRTVYLGQNNIFYLRKENFLKSKLAILNQVMLEGGNAGIQVLHGQWDRHTRWEEGDANTGDDTHLDKVAWNEGSKLWFAEVNWEADESGMPTNHVKMEVVLDKNGEPVVDKDGKTVKRVSLKNQILLESNENIINYLDLIPAEISGGDGQRLIAPHKDFMGKNYRYYLAPVKSGNPEGVVEMDRDLAVEISYNHLVALIHKIIGPVDVFTNGKMYFSVPVPHKIREYGPNRGENAWKQFGSFGQVRNHWYNITVDAITRMGTPVDVPSQPIIPVMDVKRSYINMGVSVKEWHNIEQDNIPMM